VDLYAPKMPVTHSDEELRKRLLPLAVAGVPIVLIDNIAGEFGSEAMDMVLTSNAFRDRKLGVSEDSGDAPWRSVMIAEPSTAPAGPCHGQATWPLDSPGFLASTVRGNVRSCGRRPAVQPAHAADRHAPAIAPLYPHDIAGGFRGNVRPCVD
jgi:hypothetical protein